MPDDSNVLSGVSKFLRARAERLFMACVARDTKTGQEIFRSVDSSYWVELVRVLNYVAFLRGKAILNVRMDGRNLSEEVEAEDAEKRRSEAPKASE